MNEKLNPILRGASTVERFLVVGVSLILAEMGKLDEAIGQVGGDGANFEQRAAGKPIIHWMGKTREQVREEAGDEGYAEVAEAFAVAKMPFAGDENRPPIVLKTRDELRKSFDQVAAENSRAADELLAANQERSNGLIVGSDSTLGSSNPPAATDEPEHAGIKYSELAQLSDEDLLGIEGVGKALIDKIREWDKQQKAKESAD